MLKGIKLFSFVSLMVVSLYSLGDCQTDWNNAIAGKSFVTLRNNVQINRIEELARVKGNKCHAEGYFDNREVCDALEWPLGVSNPQEWNCISGDDDDHDD